MMEVFVTQVDPNIKTFYDLLNQVSRFIKSNPFFYIKGKHKWKIIT